jgi:hypothetical protein
MLRIFSYFVNKKAQIGETTLKKGLVNFLIRAEKPP